MLLQLQLLQHRRTQETAGWCRRWTAAACTQAQRLSEISCIAFCPDIQAHCMLNSHTILKSVILQVTKVAQAAQHMDRVLLPPFTCIQGLPPTQPPRQLACIRSTTTCTTSHKKKTRHMAPGPPSDLHQSRSPPKRPHQSEIRPTSAFPIPPLSRSPSDPKSTPTQRSLHQACIRPRIRPSYEVSMKSPCI